VDNSARDAHIVDAYRSGESLRAIAARLELSHERIRQILSEQGVTLRSRSLGVRLSRAAVR
jgi:DNA-directed RNA polymerase sigma subunit (sigma70/sigma32)